MEKGLRLLANALGLGEERRISYRRFWSDNFYKSKMRLWDVEKVFICELRTCEVEDMDAIAWKELLQPNVILDGMQLNGNCSQSELVPVKDRKTGHR